MARRLVEAGTRFVTVHYDCVDGYGWDSHRNSNDVRDHLLPSFDQGCSALLTDLHGGVRTKAASGVGFWAEAGYATLLVDSFAPRGVRIF